MNCVIFPETMDSYRSIVERCRENGRQTGIFASTDRMAARLHGLLLQGGLVPGGRVKLIGYDDMYLARHLAPSLTTVSQPFIEAGRLAVDKLVDIIYDRPVESVVLKPELIVRETT